MNKAITIITAIVVSFLSIACEKGNQKQPLSEKSKSMSLHSGQDSLVQKKSITILSSAEGKDLLDLYEGENDYEKKIDHIRPACDGIGIVDSIEGSIITIDAYVEGFCPVENEQEFFWRVGETICGQNLLKDLIAKSIDHYGIGSYEDHKKCLYRHYARKFLH